MTRHISPAAALAALLLVGPGSPALRPAAAQDADKAAQLIAQVREALGGRTLEGVKALSAQGGFRREMGPRQMEGTLAMTIAPPDRMHRSEEMELPGGASVERISALAGETSWEDSQNRGGMGGGMMVMRFRGPDGQEMTEEQVAQARTRRLQAEQQRWLLALLATGQGLTYAGTAESPDGKADVLELKDARGEALRLFVDATTHRPLMLTYRDVRPRIMMMGGPGGPGGRGGRGGPGGGPGGPGGGGPGGGPDGGRMGGGGRGPGGQPPTPEQMEQMRQRMAERMREQGPPPMATITLRFDDYKAVDGVLLPHRIDQSVDGTPSEEWTIEKYRVNPSLKADFFTKKP